MSEPGPQARLDAHTSAAAERRLQRRYAAERRFRFYGAAAIAIALGALGLLLGSIVFQGASAFVQHEVTLDVHFDPAILDPEGTRDRAVLSAANYPALVR